MCIPWVCVCVCLMVYVCTIFSNILMMMWLFQVTSAIHLEYVYLRARKCVCVCVCLSVYVCTLYLVYDVLIPGDKCDTCADGFYNFSAVCIPCNCNTTGTEPGTICDK